MTRINVVLLLALLASALYLVKVSYDSRRVFSALEKAQAEGRALQTDHKQLDAERQAQATNLRVEKVARDRLAMRNAGPAVTEYVVDAANPAAAEVTAAAAATATATGTATASAAGVGAPATGATAR
jgi:cell division protein FtsL